MRLIERSQVKRYKEELLDTLIEFTINCWADTISSMIFLNSTFHAFKQKLAFSLTTIVYRRKILVHNLFATLSNVSKKVMKIFDGTLARK